LRKSLIYWNAFEIPDNYDLGFFAARLAYLRALPQLWMVAVLGLAGLALPARGPLQRLLRWEVLIYMLSVVLFYVNARFRVVMVPLLLCGAAVLAQGLFEALAARSGKRLLWMAIVLAAGVALTHSSVCDDEKGRVEAFAWARYGELLLKDGHLAEAQAVLSKAHAANPRDAYANRGLAELAMRRRDFTRAAAHALEGLRYGVEDPAVYRKIATALNAAGRREQAVDFLIQATLLEPEQPEPLALLRGLGLSEQQILERQSASRP
jgi:tetratricopeptide (TPR) repeat protein